MVEDTKDVADVDARENFFVATSTGIGVETSYRSTDLCKDKIESRYLASIWLATWTVPK